MGVAAATLLLYAGWIGTERIWYARLWRGGGMTAGELVRFTRAFVFRYLALGGVMVGLAVPFLFLGSVFEVQAETAPAQMLNALIGIASGIVFTFIVPALAYTTASVGEGFRLGFSMLGEEWPKAALYILVPPLVVTPLLYGIVPRLHVGAQIPFFIALGLLALLFKGAIAAYYLRRHDSGDDGAAFTRE